jgi:hypothetical protein
MRNRQKEIEDEIDKTKNKLTSYLTNKGRIINMGMLLLFLVSFTNAFQQIATPNATIYLYPEINKTTSYNVVLYGNDENVPVVVSLSLEGDVTQFAIIQNNISMRGNVLERCCEWYAANLTISIPGDYNKTITGKIWATANEEISGGGMLLRTASMKNVVLYPSKPHNNEVEGNFSNENTLKETIIPTTVVSSVDSSWGNLNWENIGVVGGVGCICLCLIYRNMNITNEEVKERER